MIRLVPILLLSACATQSISLRSGPRSFTAADYERVYEAWTRSEEDFAWARLGDVLRVDATFESWEFRWAYVVRYADDHALDAAARESMLRATLEDAQTNHRFFVTLAGPDFRESDLSGRFSAWRVLLVDQSGRQTEPTEIERVRRPGAAERTYFPSTSVHRQTFRVVFPATHDDGTPTIPDSSSYLLLRFTGAIGRVDLRWDFSEHATE